MNGNRIVDLTTVILFPWATQILGDMGADIIKIETPAGNATRNLGPCKNEDLASMYLASNRNKCSIMLDLTQEAGQIIPMSAWWH